MAKMADSILLVLSILRYWAIVFWLFWRSRTGLYNSSLAGRLGLYPSPPKDL